MAGRLFEPMKQSIALVTLGVADLDRATAFYRSLGWSTALEDEETAIFRANGVVLVLWSREKLAADMGIVDSDDGWGHGPPRPPTQPSDAPRGGLPLPDAEPALIRLRDHRRLGDMLPRRERRPAREPARDPVRNPDRRPVKR